jgi:Zn-finger nucleic acid-binding protein
MQATRTGMGRESSLELKYCERCGGLWLRPAGGNQIYCVICSRAMAELPPSLKEKRAKNREGKRWSAETEFENHEVSRIEMDGVGGVA